MRCPHCSEACPGYDTRCRESGGNLDAWGYKTFLVCKVHRVQFREHGVVTIQVSWAEGSSRYTAQFKAEVIVRLREASVRAVGRRMRLSWDAVDGGMQRAVAQGRARRKTKAVRRISVDETSFRRRAPVRDRGYGTWPVSGFDTVPLGRGRGAVRAFCEGLVAKCWADVESVSMDMLAPHLGDPADDP